MTELIEQQKTHPVQRFLSWAQSRVKAKDRGALANLRRGFSSGTEDRCWSYIAEYCDLTNDRQRIIWQTIAAGFATHEATANCGNLGSTLRGLALEGSTGKPEDALKSFDTRFRRLLTCSNATEVCMRLPGLIKAAQRKGFAIDYEMLYADLWYFGERVKLRWAASYWGAEEVQSEGGENQ
jgi:CRISPR type I-E-associated protein CasB/Cse2